MKNSRRVLLSLMALALTTMQVAPLIAQAKVETSWEVIVKRWLQVLLPLDALGRGGDNKEIWQALRELMQNPDFSEGFNAGLQAIDSLPLPSNDAELNKLLRSNDLRSQFLNAFFEIIIESFYGSALGWSDVGLASPPQPNGYIL